MDILISFCNTYEVPGLPNLGIFRHETGAFNLIKLPEEIPQTGMVGMTTSEEFIFIGLQHSKGGIHATQSPPGLLVFDRKNFELLNWYECRLILDFHSLLLKDDHTLLVASTGTDDIVEIQLNGHDVIAENVMVHLGNGERKDNNHVNSICAWKDDIYITGFGPKQEGGDWSTARNGFVMNLNTGEKLVEGLEHPHSLTVILGDLAYCESRKKSIRFVGQDEKISLPGYTRGLCMAGDSIYAGTSKHRKKSKSTGKKITSADEGSLGCTLNIISSKDLGLEKTIDLNNYVFEIYDLLPLQRTAAWPVIQPDNYRLIYERSWIQRAQGVLDEIQNTVPKNGALLLVDDAALLIEEEILPGYTCLPFLERDGQSWGAPKNDEDAMAELKRMQKEKSAEYLAFAWPSFWWFDIYPAFTGYLRQEFECVLDNNDVVIFKLNGSSS